MGVKVKLTGDGLNYETEATVIQAAKIIGFLNTQETLPGNYTNAQQTESSQAGFLGEKVRQMSSPREAIMETGAKTNAQKIVVLGSYILERDSTDEFSSGELKSLFLKAGEPAPRNLSRDVRDAVRAGYIAESFDKSDSYIVTNTGRKAASDGFKAHGDPLSRRRKTHGGNGLKAKPAVIPEWLRDLSISDQLDNFPSYRKMKTRSDKILWILQWAKDNKKERLNGGDIVCIADKISDNIPRSQIAATLSPYLSKSYVSKTADGYNILYEGTEYLKGIKG